LLALFDGRCDADSAFFSRRIRVDGDTRAVVALHNTLEAAELTLADLLGVGPPFRDRLNAGLAGALGRVRPVSPER
jgi:predicted lipid carrier protein YhbT